MGLFWEKEPRGHFLPHKLISGKRHQEMGGGGVWYTKAQGGRGQAELGEGGCQKAKGTPMGWGRA